MAGGMLIVDEARAALTDALAHRLVCRAERRHALTDLLQAIEVDGALDVAIERMKAVKADLLEAEVQVVEADAAYRVAIAAARP